MNANGAIRTERTTLDLDVIRRQAGYARGPYRSFGFECVRGPGKLMEIRGES